MLTTPLSWMAGGHPEDLRMSCRRLAEAGVAGASPTATRRRGDNVPVRPPGMVLPDRLRHG